MDNLWIMYMIYQLIPIFIDIPSQYISIIQYSLSIANNISFDNIPIIIWLVVDLPLWNIWVRQLGWWNSQLNGKIKNVPDHQPGGKMMNKYKNNLNNVCEMWQMMEKKSTIMYVCVFYLQQRWWNLMRTGVIIKMKTVCWDV